MNTVDINELLTNFSLTTIPENSVISGEAKFLYVGIDGDIDLSEVKCTRLIFLGQTGNYNIKFPKYLKELCIYNSKVEFDVIFFNELENLQIFNSTVDFSDKSIIFSKKVHIQESVIDHERVISNYLKELTIYESNLRKLINLPNCVKLHLTQSDKLSLKFGYNPTIKILHGSNFNIKLENNKLIRKDKLVKKSKLIKNQDDYNKVMNFKYRNFKTKRVN